MDTEKKFDVKELDEDELSRVTGAGRCKSGCPSCEGEGYTNVIIEVKGQQVLHRKCSNCGTVYR